ncbi:MAG: transposase [Neisseriaceae bacterium]|nr:transposase [Neisseriaceae bacterium]
MVGFNRPRPLKKSASDLLFRRFVGLNLFDAIPDYSSIWCFKTALRHRKSTLSWLKTQCDAGLA